MSWYLVSWTVLRAFSLSPRRLAHSNTNSIFLEGIQPGWNHWAKTTSYYFCHFHHNQILIYTAKWNEATWRERNSQSIQTAAREFKQIDCKCSVLPLSDCASRPVSLSGTTKDSRGLADHELFHWIKTHEHMANAWLFIQQLLQMSTGAIQVLRNAFFQKIGPPPTPLVTLIMLNLTPL